MKGPTLVDTGPIVALLNRREARHTWAREQFSEVQPPALTCEAVISECSFLFQQSHGGVDALMELLARGVLATPFSLTSELSSVAKLLKKYHSVPMSFADACLVRMSELFADSELITLDDDFRIYRKSGRLVIPTRMPR